MTQVITLKVSNVSHQRTFEKKRLFTHTKMQQFFHSLQEASWQSVLEEMDPDKSYNCFSEIMKMYLNLMFSQKKCTVKGIT